MSTAACDDSAIRHAREAAPRLGRLGLAVAVELMMGDGPCPAVTGNLSSTGAFVVTRRLLPVGSRVAVRLPLPSHGSSFVVDAEVRWIRSALWGEGEGRPAGMGVRFLDRPPGLALCVAELLAAREADEDPGREA